VSRTSKRKARRKRPKPPYMLTPNSPSADPRLLGPRSAEIVAEQLVRSFDPQTVLGMPARLPEHGAVWGPSPLTSFRRLFSEFLPLLSFQEASFILQAPERPRETPMTEHEWLTTEDPLRMLDWMNEGHQVGKTNMGRMLGLSKAEQDRQRDFVACAWYRYIEPHGEENERHVRHVEDHGRGEPGWETFDATRMMEYCRLWAGRGDVGVFRKAGASIIRDVVGNPFRPYTLPADERWPRDAIVYALALEAYQHRNAAGELDPFRLSVVADALEDAGCSDAYVLGHLRGVEQLARLPCRACAKQKEFYPQYPDIKCNEHCGGYEYIPVKPAPHVRSCHVLEALLGQS
jgi:hypothetical protein